MRLKNPCSKPYGFTLIEIMLVIVVMALISVYAMKTMRALGENSTVQKAADQAINIQQATMSYYIKNNQWPASLQVVIDDHFLPKVVAGTGADVRCSPFALSTNSTNCGSFAEFTTPSTNQSNGSYFTLKLVTPSVDTAKLLAAKLPSAWVSGTEVNTAIPIPGQTSNIDAAFKRFFSDKGWIVSAGILGTNNNEGYGDKSGNAHGTVYLPACPKGYEGHVFTAPKLFSTGFAESNKNVDINKRYNMYIRVGDATKYKNGWTTTVYTNENASQYKALGLTMYMTMCLPVGYWSSNSYFDMNKANLEPNGAKSYADSQIGGNPSWASYIQSVAKDNPILVKNVAQADPSPSGMYDNCYAKNGSPNPCPDGKKP